MIGDEETRGAKRRNLEDFERDVHSFLFEYLIELVLGAVRNICHAKIEFLDLFQAHECHPYFENNPAYHVSFETIKKMSRPYSPLKRSGIYDSLNYRGMDLCMLTGNM